MRESFRRSIADPRHFQLAVLTALLGYGALVLDFEVRAATALAAACGAVGTQLLLSRKSFDPRSALISSLSLALLFRTTSIGVAFAVGAIAIGSKFALQHGGKHVFNPTAFGIAVALLLFDDAWVSGGQWGTTPVLGATLACLGALVVNRARRGDVTWAFLGSYLALLFGRAWWLGDPVAIPLHAVSNGAFVIFAFFMISDPRTTPDARRGRIAFAALVAAGALAIRFGLYQPNALIWSLVVCAPLVPVIDRLLPGDRYEWKQAERPPTRPGGTRDEANDPAAVLAPVPWSPAR